MQIYFTLHFFWIIELQHKRIEVQDVDFNPEFITKLLPKLDFAALRQAAAQVGYITKLLHTLRKPHF